MIRAASALQRHGVLEGMGIRSYEERCLCQTWKRVKMG